MKHQITLLIAVIAAAISSATTVGAESCDDPRVEDTLVIGCPPGQPGEVWIDSLRGNLGETISVAVSANLNTRIDAFLIDLMFPDVIEFDSATIQGTLAEQFTFFGTNTFPGGVRFGGFGGDAFIPEGSVGPIAILTFVVTAAGCDPFDFLNLLDNLEGYEACASSPPPAINAAFDVKPGRCPNRASLRTGVVSTVVAGSDQLDVGTIDPLSIRMRITGRPNPSIIPVSQTIEVLSDPLASDCNCSVTPPDARADLVLDFSSADMRQLISTTPDARPVSLEIVGLTTDGSEFSGSDCLGVIHFVEAEVRASLDPVRGQYHVSEPGPVRLRLYDVSGRLRDVLLDAPHAAGTYSLDLQSVQLPSGVYFLRFETAAAATSHKVVLIR